MAIVTISHEMGSGGSVIGATLAERLQYRYVDQDIISEAARQYGVVEDKLSELDETRPSLFERFDAEKGHYITVLQAALLDVAEKDNVVIVGRSGQVLLRGIGHVLRIFVMAPVDLRVKRMMKKMASEMKETVDLRTTAELVRGRDQEKVGRMRYVFDVDWRDPALYDLVINTEKLAIEAAVDHLCDLLRRPEFVRTEESQQLVSDRALAARVRVALAAHPGIRGYRFNVAADRGVIRLEGARALEEAAQVVRAVPGVVAVKEQLLEMPPMPPFMV